jgi:hypothetical protein
LGGRNNVSPGSPGCHYARSLSLAKNNAKLLRYVTQGVQEDEPLPLEDGTAVEDDIAVVDAGDGEASSDTSPDSSSESAEQLAKCKYPFVAAEIVCCGRDEMMATLFKPENERLLDEFFAFLQKAAPLDPGVYLVLNVWPSCLSRPKPLVDQFFLAISAKSFVPYWQLDQMQCVCCFAT